MGTPPKTPPGPGDFAAQREAHQDRVIQARDAQEERDRQDRKAREEQDREEAAEKDREEAAEKAREEAAEKDRAEAAEKAREEAAEKARKAAENPEGSDVGEEEEEPEEVDANADAGDDEDIEPLDVDYSHNLTSLINVADDDSFAENTKRAFGSAKIMVDDLSETWRNTDTIGFGNRDLKASHVTKLKAAFEDKVFRADPSKQLRVSFTKEEFEGHLRNTVKLRVRWSKTKNHVFFGVAAPTVEGLKQQIRRAMRSPKTFEEAPAIYCDRKIIAPQLDCGQHRKAALIRHTDQRLIDAEVGPERMQALGWVCQLVDMGQTDDQYYRKIRVNQHDVYDPDSEAAVFTQIDPVYENFLQEEVDRKANNKKGIEDTADPNKDKRWKAFLARQFQTAPPDAKRYQTLLKDSFWRVATRKYNTYAYARQIFKVSQFETAAGQHLDEYWAACFLHQAKVMDYLFTPDSARKIRLEDLNLLHRIGVLGAVKNEHKLNLVFFPSRDTKGSLFGVKGPWYDDPEVKKVLTIQEHDEGVPHELANKQRRPYFLNALTSGEYCAVYQRCKNTNITVFSPKDLPSDIANIGSIMANLLRHVVFWVDYTWTMPKNNQVALKYVNYTKLLQKLYLDADMDAPVKSSSTFDVDDDSDEEMNLSSFTSQEELEKRVAIDVGESVAKYKLVIDYLRALAAMVRRTSPQWKQLPAKSKDFHEKNLSQAAVNATVAAEYRGRFDYQPWSGVLTLTIKMLGSKFMSGVMTPWVTQPDRHASDRMTSLSSLAEPWLAAQMGSRLGPLVDFLPANHLVRASQAIERIVAAEELRSVMDLESGLEKYVGFQKEAKEGLDGKDPTAVEMSDFLVDLNKTTQGKEQFAIGLHDLVTRFGTVEAAKERVLPFYERRISILSQYGVKVTKTSKASTVKQALGAAKFKSLDAMASARKDGEEELALPVARSPVKQIPVAPTTPTSAKSSRVMKRKLDAMQLEE